MTNQLIRSNDGPDRATNSHRGKTITKHIFKLKFWKWFTCWQITFRHFWLSIYQDLTSFEKYLNILVHLEVTFQLLVIHDIENSAFGCAAWLIFTLSRRISTAPILPLIMLHLQYKTKRTLSKILKIWDSVYIWHHIFSRSLKITKILHVIL